MIRQAVWSELSNELARPVNSATIEQVAKDTVAFLQAMGLKATEYPSPSTLESWIPAEAGAELWKWKKRLRSAFGMTKFSSRRQKSSSTAGMVTDPALIPLPQMPKKIEQGNLKSTTTGGVFSTTAGRSPYFQDSHMVKPRSAKRQERADRAADNSKATENTRRGTGKSMRRRFQADDDSSSEEEGYDGDGGVQMNEYPRTESRYYSAKREDKEHVCDYLNRLNGYARNADIQFDNGGRKARDHVQRFLETCGDRGLEPRLCHVRVRDTHELEEMITDILRIEKRSSTRDNSHQHSRSRDHPRRREDRRHDDSRDNYYKKDRRDRDNDRRRDDSRNTPRISLAEASIADMLAELHCQDGRTTLNEFASARGCDRSDRSSDDGSERGSDDSGCSNEKGGDELPPDESGRFLAAANESERRAAAEGTYARTDNRQHRGDRLDRNFNRNFRPDDRQLGRDNRSRQYGPCAACGSPYHSKYARKLRLREILGHGRCMDVQGITKGKTTTTRRASVKITLGWERLYVFELWIMDHNAGVDVVLGTDFMIPAGVQLDLFQANAKLPEEVMIPLIKTMSMLDEPEVPQTKEGPTESMAIPGREWREFKLRRNKPPTTTHELWIRRTEKLIPSVTKFHKGRPTPACLTNLTDRLVLCPTHLAIVAWVPIGTLPKQVGYVRLDSKKYSEWQVLAYEDVRDKTPFRRERELYEEWLAAQPPAVDRPSYTHPKQILLSSRITTKVPVPYRNELYQQHSPFLESSVRIKSEDQIRSLTPGWTMPLCPVG
ncbi:unnamed protein product [Phytophthora fragariaefolia]|uniref:Unnamed protein product n=1 Tax=Phytophthora fragariaefolia TaxID=1490495 RepID=A0A9W6XZR6_9STRA|nr:unnamed protein product [Phytophthora fragariaefolia]